MSEFEWGVLTVGFIAGGIVFSVVWWLWSRKQLANMRVKWNKKNITVDNEKG